MDKAEQPTITRAGIEAATAETERLRLELDITNADHIALWLEENVIPHDALRLCQSWLAVQIVEAHERDLARHRTTSLAAQDGLVEALRAARRVIRELDQYQSDPRRGDYGVECACCMGELLDDHQDAIAQIDAALSAIKEQHHD